MQNYKPDCLPCLWGQLVPPQTKVWLTGFNDASRSRLNICVSVSLFAGNNVLKPELFGLICPQLFESRGWSEAETRTARGKSQKAPDFQNILSLHYLIFSFHSCEFKKSPVGNLISKFSWQIKQLSHSYVLISKHFTGWDKSWSELSCCRGWGWGYVGDSSPWVLPLGLHTGCLTLIVQFVSIMYNNLSLMKVHMTFIYVVILTLLLLPYFLH